MSDIYLFIIFVIRGDDKIYSLPLSRQLQRCWRWYAYLLS